MNGPWLIDLICCGYRVSTEHRATWGEADRLRDEWAASGQPHHTDRRGIVRALDTPEGGQ